MIGIGLGTGGANTCGGSRTVVTVGDVEGIHLAELVGDGGDVGFSVDEPEGMAETVDVGHEIIERLFLGDALDESEQRGIVTIGQEGGTDVGVGGGEMTHAVVFLVAAGEFVLLDAAGIVVVDMSGEDDAVLRVAVHGLGVEVIALALVLYEPTFGNEAFELPARFGVDTGIVLFGVLGKVDFGADDAIERAGIVAGLGTGFGGVEHIVRTRRNKVG